MRPPRSSPTLLSAPISHNDAAGGVLVESVNEAEHGSQPSSELSLSLPPAHTQSDHTHTQRVNTHTHKE